MKEPSEIEGECPLCGTKFSKSIYSDESYQIALCAECRLGATDPTSYVASSHYDEIPQMASDYAAQESKFRDYFRQTLLPLRERKDSGRLLDVGCSVGLLVDEARVLGFDAEGIDLDGNAVEYGKSIGRPVEKAALNDWPGREYDVITLSHTLEHISEPVLFMKELADHLAPDGILLIVVPCFCGLHPRVFNQKWYGWLPSQHYYHYSAPALDKLFAQAGLKTEKVWQNTMDHRFDWTNVPRRTLPRHSLNYLVAKVGNLIGQGDQLNGIARRIS